MIKGLVITLVSIGLVGLLFLKISTEEERKSEQYKKYLKTPEGKASLLRGEKLATFLACEVYKDKVLSWNVPNSSIAIKEVASFGEAVIFWIEIDTVKMRLSIAEAQAIASSFIEKIKKTAFLYPITDKGLTASFHFNSKSGDKIENFHIDNSAMPKYSP